MRVHVRCGYIVCVDRIYEFSAKVIKTNRECHKELYYEIKICGRIGKKKVCAF